MILCETRRHAQTHFKFHVLEHSTLALAMSWDYTAAKFAGLGWPVFVGVTFQPRNVCWSRTQPSNQARGGAIFTSSRSWIKFLTRKSLKSQCIYFAPQEDKRIQLLSTVRSTRWKNNFYGTLEGTSTHQISCWPYDKICRCTQRGSLYHSTMWCFTGWLLTLQKFPSPGLCWSACILLVCPSKPTQSNFPSFLPVRLPFSISIFSVQIQGVSFLFGCTILHELIFLVSKSSESLGNKKNCP